MVRTRVFSSDVRDSESGGIGIVEFVSLKDESETGHGGGADDRDGGGHGEAVGLGRGGRRTTASSSSAGTSGLSGSGGDGLGAGLVGVGAGVGGNALTSGVGSEGVTALETDVGGGSELHNGVGRGGADVSGAADGVAVGLDSNVGGRLYDGSVNRDEGSRNSNVGGSLDVGNHNASGIGGGSGDCASGAGAAGAVGLVLAAVRVAVCEDGGGKAEDEAVLDLHVEGC
jgi:fibronectin-binding autotransporter adhesin